MVSFALYEKYKTQFHKYGVNTHLRVSHFMAQIHHESHLKPISENLNYSAQGLLNTFPKYFTHSTALAYARKPQAIANKVYSNRIGNGDEASGDGWKYRGKGFIQITGKANYTALSEGTGVDYLNDPDKLLNEADSVISALWFWSTIAGNALADKDDVKAITKKINGGYNGLADRTQLLEQYKNLDFPN